jgi:hypothetical protein
MTRFATVALLGTAIAALFAAPASAAPPEPKPALTISSLATPTNFAPDGEPGVSYTYDLRVANLGGEHTDGSKVTISDTLPAGLTVKSVGMELRSTKDAGKFDYGSEACHVATLATVATVTCEIFDGLPESAEPAVVEPGEERRVVIEVNPPEAEAEGETLTNHVVVDGGGAPPASVTARNEVNSSPAPGGISFFHTSISGRDGQPAGQASSHPYQFTAGFAVNTKAGPAGGTSAFVPAGGDIKDITVSVPPGLVGNPNAMARCTPLQFSTTHTVIVGHGGTNGFFGANECPDSSAVGLVLVQQIEGTAGVAPVPLYNLAPPPGVAAEFGAQILNLPFFIDFEVRPDDNYKIVARLRNLTQVKRLTAATTVIWGNPADPAHNPVRGSCLNELVEILPLTLPGCQAQVGVEEKPFLRLPTSCASPLDIGFSFDNWTHPGEFISEASNSPAPSGCNQVEFEPSFEARPTTEVADAPSGLHADLHIPQNEEPEGLGAADLRKTVVTLPKGLVVNPSSANGLAACSPAQIGLTSPAGESPGTFTAAAAQCPAAARIGEVKVDTPLIDHPLPGSVYVAAPHDNPFGSLLAIYVAVHDPQSGVVVKLAGRVEPDLQTGQLTATFDETPQTPFEDFGLDFFGGPLGALRTPAVCGKYSTTSTMTPWSAPESGPPVTSSNSYPIAKAPGGAPCPASEGAEPNAPSFDAGTAAPLAGAYSPLVIHLRREDGSQEFSALTVATPPGLIGRLAGIPSCSDAALAAAAGRSGREELAHPSCPAASEVGTVNVGAGAGPSPYYTDGRAYLAGPYKGAPLSLAIVTPAVAGPFDLGTVVVRTALFVDPETARITAKSDPIPHILQGIPLDVRTVAVKLDRPNFTLNPTSCDPLSFSGQVASVLGQAAPLTQRFQVGECGRLRFAPKLSLRLSGATKRSGHPALRSVVTYPKGAYSNIAKASVALPHSEFLAQNHIRTICTRVQFAAHACPAGSIYGHARATSPLVDYAVEGPVYLRSSSHPLPDLVLALRGPDSQPIEVDAVARIDSIHGGIRATFDSIPDLPVSRFVLSMQGGSKGLLENSRNICAGTNRAVAKFDAQNGKVADETPVVKAQCGKKGAGKKHRAG